MCTTIFLQQVILITLHLSSFPKNEKQLAELTGTSTKKVHAALRALINEGDIIPAGESAAWVCQATPSTLRKASLYLQKNSRPKSVEFFCMVKTSR